MKLHGKTITRNIVSLVIIVFVFYFLFDNLLINYHKLSEFEIEVNYPRLFFSFILLLLVFLFNPLAWMMLLNRMEENIDFKASFSILYASQLGKYVPGKFWSYIAQVYLSVRRGISGEKTFLSSLLFQAVSSVTSLYVFVISLLSWNNIPVCFRVSVFILVSALGFIAIKSGAFNGLLNFVLNKILKRNIHVQFPDKVVLYVVSIFIASWIAFGIAYYYFLNAFYAVDPVTAIKFTGIYTISWLIGYASLLTPGGLGIREGVQVYMLNMWISLPMSIIISLACRIWLTVGELAIALISFFLIIKKHSKNPRAE